MQNDQERRAHSETSQYATPKPQVAPRVCLIVLGHRAILLPLYVRAKANAVADTPPYLGIAYKDLSRDAFADICRASVSAPNAFGVHTNALQFMTMNPDKLFDYLEGKLPAPERAALEQRLISDEQLQRELAVARQIHAGMRGNSREVLLPPEPDVTEQGRKMALRVGAAFIILMAVNVGFGLWLIARHETKNPNRALLETQMREQVAKSLEHAAAALTPAPNALGVGEIIMPAATGKLDAVADQVVTIASRFGGAATKGLPDRGRISILVDLPANRESEFRAAIASICGGPVPAAPATTTSPAAAEKKSFVVQIVEEPGKPE